MAVIKIKKGLNMLLSGLLNTGGGSPAPFILDSLMGLQVKVAFRWPAYEKLVVPAPQNLLLCCKCEYIWFTQAQLARQM